MFLMASSCAFPSKNPKATSWKTHLDPTPRRPLLGRANGPICFGQLSAGHGELMTDLSFPYHLRIKGTFDCCLWYRGAEEPWPVRPDSDLTRNLFHRHFLTMIINDLNKHVHINSMCILQAHPVCLTVTFADSSRIAAGAGIASSGCSVEGAFRSLSA